MLSGGSLEHSYLWILPSWMGLAKIGQMYIGACMLQLVEDWVVHKHGTGDLPRTWTTVVQAVKDMEAGPLAQQLAEQYIR